MGRDKKNRGGKIRFVLPRSIGKVELTDAAGEDDVRAVLAVALTEQDGRSVRASAPMSPHWRESRSLAESDAERTTARPDPSDDGSGRRPADLPAPCSSGSGRPGGCCRATRSRARGVSGVGPKLAERSRRPARSSTPRPSWRSAGGTGRRASSRATTRITRRRSRTSPTRPACFT